MVSDLVSGGGKLKQADRERSLQALMTINLLKRLESSVQSFRLTLQKLKDNHVRTLEKIKVFERTGKDATFADVAVAFENAEPDDDELPDIDDAKIGGKVQISLSDMDLPSWKHDLNADLIVIDTLLSEMLKIAPADDAKLQHLKTQINSKLASPINPGNRKILIFTAFADTAAYLYEHLAQSILQSHQIHTGKVTGSDTPVSTLKSNAKQSYDLPPGVMFTLRNRNKGVNVHQHNRLHPYYLVYIGQNGEVIADHTEVKRLLDLVRSACKGQSKPVADVCRLVSQATDDGRKMAVYSDLLGLAIRSMVDAKEDKDIDSLFSGGRTTALVDTIAGLDDFELIAFLVVQG